MECLYQHNYHAETDGQPLNNNTNNANSRLLALHSPQEDWHNHTYRIYTFRTNRNAYLIGCFQNFSYVFKYLMANIQK